MCAVARVNVHRIDGEAQEGRVLREETVGGCNTALPIENATNIEVNGGV